MNSFKVLKYVIFDLLVVTLVTAIFALNTISYNDLVVDVNLIFSLFRSEEIIGMFLFALSILTPVLAVVYFATKYYSNQTQNGLYVRLSVIGFLFTLLFGVILELQTSLTCGGEGCMALAFIPIYVFWYFVWLTVFSIISARLISHSYTSPSTSAFLSNLPKKLRKIGILLLIVVFVYSILLVVDISSCGIFGGIRPVSYNNCLVQKALMENNFAVCEQSRDSDNCLYRLALETQDHGLCEKIEYQTLESQCYIAIAKETNDSLLCEKIKLNNDDAINTCFQALAYSTNNISLCEKISDRHPWLQQSECYQKFAVSTKDISLCYKIQNKEYLDSCIEGLENR